MNDLIMGIDTSCYTTSVAFMDAGGTLVHDFRKPLEVKQGEKGLRQSEAFFQHVKQLPEFMEKAAHTVNFGDLKAIGVSESPRPLEGSYMPVFSAGERLAASLGAVLRVPVYKFSHQEGHIAAGLWSAANIPEQPSFLCVQLSGGTSEILLVRKKAETGGYDIEIIGGTGDISAGQLIDRCGVALGLSFPSGPELEKLARGYKGELPELSVSVKGTNFHFSGAEREMMQYISEGEKPEGIALAVQDCISHTLVRSVKKASQIYAISGILFVGGVCANRYIRTSLEQCLNEMELYFAGYRYCSDNAVGIAVMAGGRNKKSSYK